MSRTAARDGSGFERARDALLLLAVVLAAWQGLYASVGEVAITSPLDTLAEIEQLLRSPVFWENVGATATALAVSAVIAGLAGVAAGLALGFHRFSGIVAEPILAALYTLPKVTLYPVVLLVFGLGLSAKIAFGVMHGVIPVVLFTMSAVRNIEPVHLKTARMLKLTALQTVSTILAPAVVPEIFTGLRVGFALTLLGVLIGEMFASQRGLGFMIMNGMNVHDVPTMTAVVVLLIIFAVIVSSALLALDRRLHRRG
jgi:NitT/TauT family transport system permease protein